MLVYLIIPNINTNEITMVHQILNKHSWDNCYAELLSNQCLCDTEIP